jgi:hypothetical protein
MDMNYLEKIRLKKGEELTITLGSISTGGYWLESDSKICFNVKVVMISDFIITDPKQNQILSLRMTPSRNLKIENRGDAKERRALN